MSARFIIPAFAVAAALAGCAAPSADDTVPAGPRPSAAATPAPRATPAPPDYVFGFVEKQPDVDDPRMVDWVGDECGVLVMARVSTLPVDDPFLQPDLVVEYAADGSETRRWAKPYAAEIVDIAGERLHFRADHDGASRVFWTRPDGSLGVLDDRMSDPAVPPTPGFSSMATPVACPALPAFGESPSVQCLTFVDAAGVTRRVAFEGACG